MSLKENDLLQEALREFCEERGLTPVDILHDERGAYYLATDDFSPEQVDEHKMYLPFPLQEIAQTI